MILKKIRSFSFSRLFSFTTTSAYGKNFYDYPVLNLPIDPNSELYQQYKNETEPILNTFQKSLNHILNGIDEKAKDHFLYRRNKLAIRDRVSKLLDPGSPFLELSQFAGQGLYGKDEVLAGGLVTGIGLVQGKWCMIIANDPTIKAGTYYPITIKKQIRAQEIAMENRLTCIYLVDSGGVFLPKQDEVFPDKEHFGRIFYNIANMSALGIAQISVVLGLCTAGGAYVPAMADENIIVTKNGSIFLGGPPLVKAATGEIVNAEELGGANVHCSVSGVSDHYANNEIEAFQICRSIVANIKGRKFLLNSSNIEKPLFSSEELNYIMSPNLKKVMDVNYIISRIVDGSRFLEYKKNFGSTLVTGFAQLYGQEVGILGNNGILFSESAQKGANFIEICSQRKIPLIFLQNIMGFMIGKKYENEGIAKHGAKLVNAVSTTKSPKITLLCGGSFGAGNYGMSGRAFQPRFLFSWPWSKISVMGGDQAANVLAQVKKESMLKTKTPLTSEEEADFKSKVIKQYENEGSCYYSSARIWDDGIIMPSDTRKILGLSLQIALNKEMEDTKFGVFRM